MILSFISREHGLIQELNDDTIHRINEIRQGARYADEEAAMKVYGFHSSHYFLQVSCLF